MEEKRKVMDQMRELCVMSEWGRELAISLGKALVDEFGMIRGSRVGVSWDYHKRTKEYFEVKFKVTAEICKVSFYYVLTIFTKKRDIYL